MAEGGRVIPRGLPDFGFPHQDRRTTIEPSCTSPHWSPETSEILAADPGLEIPWNEVRAGYWEARCVCGIEGWHAPDADRVRVDPLDVRTGRHLGQCEFASESDTAMLRVLLKVTDKGDYDWVECGACGAGWQVPRYVESAETIG